MRDYELPRNLQFWETVANSSPTECVLIAGDDKEHTGVNDHIYGHIYIFENFNNFKKSMTIYIYFRSVSL